MALFTINRYLGDEDESESASESRSKARLAKLQEQAKAREQQSLAAKEEVTVKDTSSGQSDLGKNKRKLEQEEKERKQHKKKRKESSEKLDDADNTAVPVEHSESGTKDTATKKKKKKDKKKEEEQDTNHPSEESTVAVQETEDDGGEPEGTQKTANGHPDPSNTGSGKSSSDTSFHVLGGFENKTVQKVQRVLPKWLAEPDAIERDIKSNLVPLSEVPGICFTLQKKLEANGIQNFFPVQAEVIPAILETVNSGLLIGRGGYRPRDICVSAPTGSGKTLAFVIPVIQALLTRVVCEVRALAVLPTKELAQQVCKVFYSYAEGTGLKVVMVAGQKPFAAEQAALSETRGGVCRSLADIVVATPGRLVDHINKNDNFSLQHLRFLIIDEADRMIDSMHQAWLSQVTKAVYKSGSGSDISIFRRVKPGPITVASLSPPQMPLQKLLFSATLTQNPEKLQQLGLHQPRLFSSTHTSTQDGTHTEEKFNFPQGLTEYYVCCTLSKKPLLLLHFLLQLKFSPALCFMNSREAAHRLFLLVKLYGGVEVAEFSSRLSPNERQKTLKRFEQGKIALLISTDAAARGIDIKGVKCVINYDAPQYIRTYIHRVGRTARAGKAGVAFTFLLGVQVKNFVQMVLNAGSAGLQKQTIKPEHLKGMESQYEEALDELGKAIKEEKAQKRF
ncbi:ATP-dependent RNA helicase DDX51 isoform X2 [Colossoma macropomum]|uniref:ATP-dependent RNA helicase DDX51 isoform X2 n=1 Tax=Colossoma macropomum TaxID=42526 RepID=UPI0018646F7C|nr:ATP-dependent RNA helicase DDX51 isoform X2 [Colossoma macropomum]